MKANKTDLTVIVNSCDKYCDLWPPFFDLMKTNWPDCKYPVILNTESKEFSSDNGLNIICLKIFEKNSTVDWSTRLIETLKRINTEFVFCILDDEFIMESVSQTAFDRLLSIMKIDKRISSIVLDTPFTDDIFPLLKKSSVYKGLYPVPFAQYNYNSANAAIWRKSRLLHYLKQGESPWEFEINTKYRLLYYDKFFYCSKEYSPVRTSFLAICGVGIIKGQWLWNTPKLFEHFGIDVDYNKRGIFTINQERIDAQKKSLFDYYKALSQRNKKEIFKDFLDRWREIAPMWIKKVKSVMGLRFFKK